MIPAEQNPLPENPMPENPLPRNPLPGNPLPENPFPEHPFPVNPFPGNIFPGNPFPGNALAENRSRPAEQRVMHHAMIRVPANHVLLYYTCPCGTHRTPVVLPRSIFLAHVARNQIVHRPIRTASRRLEEDNMRPSSRRRTDNKGNRFPPISFEDEDDIER